MELHSFYIKYSRHCVDGVLHLIMKKCICETSYNLVQYLNVHWRDNLSSKSMPRTHNMLMLNLNSCKCDSKYWITVICFIIELLFVFSKKLSHHLIIIIKKSWVHQWYLTATVLSGFEEATLSFKKEKCLWMMVYEAHCTWTSMMMSLLCLWTRSSKNGCRERPLCLFLWQEVVSWIVLWETAKKKKRYLNGRCWKVDGQYLKQKDGCRTVIHLTSLGVRVGRGRLNNSWLQRHIWGNGD